MSYKTYFSSDTFWIDYFKKQSKSAASSSATETQTKEISDKKMKINLVSPLEAENKQIETLPNGSGNKKEKKVRYRDIFS